MSVALVELAVDFVARPHEKFSVTGIGRKHFPHSNQQTKSTANRKSTAFQENDGNHRALKVIRSDSIKMYYINVVVVGPLKLKNFHNQNQEGHEESGS